jgi:hypothetical protein
LGTAYYFLLIFGLCPSTAKKYLRDCGLLYIKILNKSYIPFTRKKSEKEGGT